MAKKPNRPRLSEYEYLRAHVDEAGEVVFRWKLKECAMPGSLAHDEPVGHWSTDEIARLARQMAEADERDPVKVEVIRDEP